MMKYARCPAIVNQKSIHYSYQINDYNALFLIFFLIKN